MNSFKEKLLGLGENEKRFFSQTVDSLSSSDIDTVVTIGNLKLEKKGKLLFGEDCDTNEKVQFDVTDAEIKVNEIVETPEGGEKKSFCDKGDKCWIGGKECVVSRSALSDEGTIEVTVDGAAKEVSPKEIVWTAPTEKVAMSEEHVTELVFAKGDGVKFNLAKEPCVGTVESVKEDSLIVSLDAARYGVSSVEVAKANASIQGEIAMSETPVAEEPKAEDSPKTAEEPKAEDSPKTAEEPKAEDKAKENETPVPAININEFKEESEKKAFSEAADKGVSVSLISQVLKKEHTK